MADSMIAESAAGAAASTIADLHRYRRAGAATVGWLPSGRLLRGAHCRLTPVAVTLGSRPLCTASGDRIDGERVIAIVAKRSPAGIGRRSGCNSRP
jgi:hypothetical protein